MASLLAIASPVQADTGFTSSAPGVQTVRVTFTIERNHSYFLDLYDDATGNLVCHGSLWTQVDGGEPGTSFTMLCSGDTVGDYTANFSVKNHTNLTPTFTWS